ncbi:MAG: anhydro-N-acetylmuramic acid kinase [Bacteroidota bacterium]
MAPTQEYIVLGIMSGSSLDGLDLALCRFSFSPDDALLIPSWEILAATTDPYPPTWQARLRSAPHLPGRELWRLHADFGHWIGQRAKRFLAEHPDHVPELVGSHGHTIFHAPEQKFTTQIGDGAAIAAQLAIRTVTELRSSDVAIGGEGAPLAPLADKYLFPEYDGFLNLGGIANLSLKQEDGHYLAGDITGCCQILDRLAQRTGHNYDPAGHLAAQGSPAPAFSPKVAALPYHQLPYPKSLDNGWVREQLWPILDDKSVPAQDLLHTFTRWLAAKIAYDLAFVGEGAGAKQGKGSQDAPRRILLTGGGSHNTFLVDQLRATQDAAKPTFDFVVATKQMVDFKEAALIALCALLRVKDIPNALPSATGAPRATINGAVYAG